PPSTLACRERLAQTGVRASYREFVDKRAKEFPIVTVLDGERLEWGPDRFRDNLHVNRDGAVRLSLAIADATARRLRDDSVSSPKWIELADIDGREVGAYRILVEDLDESRAAIEPIVVGQNSGEAIAW